MSLNHRDRRALADIERRLAAQDPGLARRMRPDRPFPTVSVLCVLLYVSAPLVSLLFGGAALLATAAAGGAGIAGVLIARRLRARAARRVVP